MKKSGLIYLGILTLIMIFVCIYMITTIGSVFSNNSDHYEYNYDENILDKYIQFQVEKGEYKLSEEYKGYISYENSLLTYELAAGKDFAVTVKKGDKIKKDDELCHNRYKTVKSTVDGLVVDMNYDTTFSITVCDKTKENIVVLIPEKHQERIMNAESIKIIYDGKEDSAHISYIDPVVEDGFFKLYLENIYNLYANTEIEVVVNYEVINDVVSIPKDYVKEDNEGNKYITLLNSNTNELTKKVVEYSDFNGESYRIISGDDYVGKTIVIDKKDSLINGK